MNINFKLTRQKKREKEVFNHRYRINLSLKHFSLNIFKYVYFSNRPIQNSLPECSVHMYTAFLWNIGKAVSGNACQYICFWNIASQSKAGLKFYKRTGQGRIQDFPQWGGRARFKIFTYNARSAVPFFPQSKFRQNLLVIIN